MATKVVFIDYRNLIIVYRIYNTPESMLDHTARMTLRHKLVSTGRAAVDGTIQANIRILWQDSLLWPILLQKRCTPTQNGARS